MRLCVCLSCLSCLPAGRAAHPPACRLLSIRPSVWFMFVQPSVRPSVCLSACVQILVIFASIYLSQQDIVTLYYTQDKRVKLRTKSACVGVESQNIVLHLSLPGFSCSAKPNTYLTTAFKLRMFSTGFVQSSGLMLSVLSLIPERELSDSDVSGRNFLYLQQPWCACLCVILKEATDTNILKRPCENSIRNGAPNPKKHPL